MHSFFKHVVRSLLHPVLMSGVRLFDNCKIKSIKKNTIDKLETPAIFVVNHSNGHDFPVVAQVIKKHFYILADYTMKKDRVVDILNRMNGCVYVDRKNQESKRCSKVALIKHLKQGHTILLFPEGTWNLHPSRLLLPLNWGCIDLSKETDTPIIPITILYRENNAYVNVGEPFLPAQDKQTEIVVLEEIMSTLLWETMCLFKPLDRATLPNNYEKQFIKEQHDTYKKLDLQYETSVIRNTGNCDNAFAHLNTISPTKQNAFLFNKRMK